LPATDLRFYKPQPVTTALRFGETAPPAITYITATMDASIAVGAQPNLTARLGYLATMDAAVDVSTTPNLTAQYDNSVNRAPFAWDDAAWQDGAALKVQTSALHEVAPKRNGDIRIDLLPGADRRADLALKWGWMSPAHRPALSVPWGEGVNLDAAVRDGFADLLRTNRPALVAPWTDGLPLNVDAVDNWIQLLRHRRPAMNLLWGEGHLKARTLTAPYGAGRPILKYTRVPWQEARRPPPGTSVVIVVPPGGLPCYHPIIGEPVDLIFRDLQPASLDLLFRCPNWTPTPGGTLVIPVLRTYIVHNDIILRRTDNSLLLPALALSLSIDSESWCWGWSASLPAAHLDNVLPASGNAPVEFEAIINGVHWLLLGEKVRRDRRFGSGRIALSGRGIAAELGAPYAPPVSRTNLIDRNAQQLMDDALMINGVGIGWSLNWGLVDWLVPAGVWNHTGSHIEAVTRIAEAAGGYVQASRSAKTLNILPRYPIMPWDWETSVTPDFALPAAVTTTESIEWQDNPAFNAVYVSGEQVGVLAQIKRQGTAGDFAAPMIVDPLTTHADAGRQRGESILGASGRIQRLTLETPILPGVGLYPVGSFVEFADGATTRLGLVRSTAITANLPVVRQTIEVECHDA
jgi:hypothetical protein